jgi:UPF0716 protein FxsA
MVQRQLIALSSVSTGVYRLPIVLLILFVVIPILEIAAFIQVGSLIGLLPTLGTILLTAVIGAFLVRQQGLRTLQEAQQASAQGELPVGPLFHGVFILIAGLLLLTPGFVTDTVGFLLLVPALRRVIGAKVWEGLKDKIEVHTGGQHDHGGASRRPQHGPGPIIDGEAVEVDEETEAGRKKTTESPWKSINHDGS